MSKCTDCEEYNHNKHYCPKFCDVIRETTKEMQEFYKGEHDKLERIEQIVNAYITDNPREPMYETEDYMNSIKEVLEKDN